MGRHAGQVISRKIIFILLIILEFEEMPGISMRQLQFLNKAQLFPDHSIINLGFYAFLISCPCISKEHHALLIREGSNSLVQLEVEEVQFSIDPSLSMVGPVADFIIDSLLCFQIKVDRALVSPHFIDGRRRETGANTAEDSSLGIKFRG